MAGDGYSTGRRWTVMSAADVAAAGLDASTVPSVEVRGQRCYVAAVDEIWHEVPIARGWIAAYRISPSRPRRHAAISELRIFPAEPAEREPGTWLADTLGTKAQCPRGGITSSVLKSVRLSHVVRELNRALFVVLQLKNFPSPALAATAESFDAFAVPKTERRKKATGQGRPPSISDLRYVEIARAYRAALDEGSGSAADDVARRFGLKGGAHVRMMVHRAKKRGLIASGSARSWVLTPDAERLAPPDLPVKKGKGHGNATRTR